MNPACSVHFKHVAPHRGSQPTERLLPAELWGIVALRIVRAALHKAFTTQCLGEPVRPQAHRQEGTRAPRWGEGQRRRRLPPRCPCPSWLTERAHTPAYKLYYCGFAAAAICAPRPRSLEVACCALICALTVCGHSMASISALCGISHRSLHSSRISVRPTLYTLSACVCECVRAVKIISDLFAFAVEMQLTAAWAWIDLVCWSFPRQIFLISLRRHVKPSLQHRNSQFNAELLNCSYVFNHPI